jgi:hypothetical protein
MSCIAKIKSPITGKPAVSSTYYQLTSFFPEAQGKNIYEALTTETFKAEFGFDWTKPQIGYSLKTNYLGEPKLHIANKLLKLGLSDGQLEAGEQIEDLAQQGYVGRTYKNKNAFKHIQAEIDLNPRYDLIDTEVISIGDEYGLSIKPAVDEPKRAKFISKEVLKDFKFPEFIVNSVEDFNNAQLTELLQSLAQSAEASEFDKVILSKLAALGDVNTKLKLAVFDDFQAPGEYQRSFYDPQSNTIYIGKSIKSDVNNKALIREIIHEAVHAYTVKVLNNPSNAQEVQFVGELTRYYDMFKANHPELKDTYGMQNVEEFVSEYLSNPVFREALQEAQFVAPKKASFLGRMVQTIKNFLSNVLGKNDSPMMFEEVGALLDGYFDYLKTIKDFPESPGEYKLRFNAPYEKVPKDFNDLGLKNFYNYINNQVDSKIWGVLSQNLQEINPEFSSVKKLKELFQDISSADLATTLTNTVAYTVALENFIQRLEKDLALVNNNTSRYTSDQLIKKYHSVIAIADALRLQAQAINTDLLEKLDFKSTKDSLLSSIMGKSSKKEQLLKKDVEAEQKINQIREVLDNVSSKADKLLRNAQSSQTLPAATILAKHLEGMVKEMNKPSHPVHEELNQLKHQRRKALESGNRGAAKIIQAEINMKQEALNFIPTVDNIIKLLNGEGKQSLNNLTIFSKYFAIGGMTGAPVADWINAFINNHITEAENFSIATTLRSKKLFEKIAERNKKKGISKNSSGKKFYQGFTRIVEIKYENQDGTITTVKQKVYQTQLKEAEFNNDLIDLRQKLAEAKRSGDEAKVEEAAKNLETFIENYAQTPYKKEYYEAEKLLTDKAREARQDVLQRIEELSSVFGDEDLEIQEENGASLRELRAKLRSEYLRLGSIFNEDGSEKPIGSEARDIAESIKSYNEARKGLEIIEFVIPEQTMLKFNLIKEGFEKKIVSKQQEITRLKEEAEIAEAEGDVAKANDKRVLIKKTQDELEVERETQKKWLEQNTRVEIDPKFFELQKAISDKISAILSKYNDNPEIGEKYQQLFDLVKGYRDQDGVIQGSMMSSALGETIKEVEQSLEDLKKQLAENRGAGEGLTKQDKDKLKVLFKELSDLQRKQVTPYYKETASKIKSIVRAEVASDAALQTTIRETAEKFLKEYREADESGLDLEDPGYRILLSQLSLEFYERFEGSQLSDYLPTDNDTELLQKFQAAIAEFEVQNRFRNTDWYKTNHITTAKGELRPIYIWTKTVPVDPQYIKRDSPTFEWATPRVREEYRNKDHNFLGEYRPRVDAVDDKYVNPEYNNLEQEDREIVDEMVEMYEDMQRLLPQSQRLVGYQTPNVTKSSREESTDFVTNPRYRLNYLLKSFKLLIERAIPGGGADQIEANIEEMRNISKSNNVRLIKTRYKVPLEAELSTDLLLDGLSQYGNYIAEFAGLQKALPVVFALRDTLQKTSQTVERVDEKFSWGKVIDSLLGTTNSVQITRALGLVDNQIEYFFYGEDIGRKTKIPPFINSAFEGLLQKTQSIALKFNAKRTIKNALNNFLQIQANAANLGLTKAELLAGTTKGLMRRAEIVGIELGSKEYTEYALKLMHFRAVPMADPTKAASAVHLGFVHQYLNWDNWSAQVFDYPEAASTLGIYEALMAKHTVPMVVNGQATFIPLSEAYEVVDGKLSPKEGVYSLELTKVREIQAEIDNLTTEFLNKVGKLSVAELTPQENIALNRQTALLKIQKQEIEERNTARKELLRQVEQQVRDKIFQSYTSTQGNYYKKGRSGYQSIIALKYVMSLKRWLFPSLSNLYGRAKLVPGTGTVQEGMYRVAIRSLAKNILSQDMYLKKTVPTTDREKNDYNRVAGNMVISGTLLAITSALVSWRLNSCDDEENPMMCWFVGSIADSALGTLEEFASLKPELTPFVMYNKFKTDPLKKKGEQEKGPFDKLMTNLSYFLTGSQIRTVDLLLESLELMFEGLMGKPYVEQSRDGKGSIKPHPYIPAYEGLNSGLVGLSKFTGFEPLLKSKYPERQILMRLKYSPFPSIENPVAEYQFTLNRMDEIKDQVLKRDPKTLLAIKNNLLKDSKGFYIPINKYTKDQKEALNKVLRDQDYSNLTIQLVREYNKLQEKKDSAELKYKILSDPKENTKLAQKEGVSDSKLLDELGAAVGGYKKLKPADRPLSQEYINAENQMEIFEYLRDQEILREFKKPE